MWGGATATGRGPYHKEEKRKKSRGEGLLKGLNYSNRSEEKKVRRKGDCTKCYLKETKTLTRLHQMSRAGTTPRQKDRGGKKKGSRFEWKTDDRKDALPGGCRKKTKGGKKRGTKKKKTRKGNPTEKEDRKHKRIREKRDTRATTLGGGLIKNVPSPRYKRMR